MAIRYTFYLASADEFSYLQSEADSREWLRSRGLLDDLDEAGVGRWVVSASMAVIRRKREEGGHIGFDTTEGAWVSMLASAIIAVKAEVGEAEEGDSVSVLGIDLDPPIDEAIRH